MYEKDIIDFFPPIEATDSNWSSYFSSSWDDSATTLDSLEKVEYIKKMNYDELLSL